ncbi:hypothetical protein [Paenibacillus pinihumi]|uniref:hypothetical protein n=1 Tax=Paenibacillus pinihumi TaxID=669462 RepID=UPI00048EA0C6|nr:hypothetical protein [Paenibacillus pinihumi]
MTSAEKQELQRKYLAHFVSKTETLPRTEVVYILEWLREDEDAYNRSYRIIEIERYIERDNRRLQAEASAEAAWLAKAREIERVKEKWWARGATWKSIGECGVYGSEWTFPEYSETFRWWSYETLDETLNNIRSFNDKLTEVSE